MSANDPTTILVVGATGAIGTAIARACAGADVRLLLVARHRDRLAALRDELSPLCKEVQVRVCDLAAVEAVETLVSELAAVGGSIDWMVQAAGYIDENEQVEPPSPGNLTTAFAVNTVAPIYLTQALRAKLGQTGGVVLISSTAALSGNPGFPVYSSSKAALHAFAQALAKDFSGTQNRVVVVCPAATNTPMRERVARDARRHQSPEALAAHIQAIMTDQNGIENGDVVVIRDGVMKRI